MKKVATTTALIIGLSSAIISAPSSADTASSDDIASLYSLIEQLQEENAAMKASIALNTATTTSVANYDIDADGYTIAQGDCDDGNYDVNPGIASDYSGNGIDDDCDGVVDDPTYAVGDVGPAGGIVIYVDEFGQSGIEISPEDLVVTGAGVDWYTAQLIAENYSLNGYSDWYLPSLDGETAKVLNAAKRGIVTNFDFQDQDGSIEYWSSQESIVFYMLPPKFYYNTGSHSDSEKGVRPIRDF